VPRTGRHAAAASGSCKCVSVLGVVVDDGELWSSATALTLGVELIDDVVVEGSRGAPEHRVHSV